MSPLLTNARTRGTAVRSIAGARFLTTGTCSIRGIQSPVSCTICLAVRRTPLSSRQPILNASVVVGDRVLQSTVTRSWRPARVPGPDDKVRLETFALAGPVGFTRHHIGGVLCRRTHR